jgi:hypothetical protein
MNGMKAASQRRRNMQQLSVICPDSEGLKSHNLRDGVGFTGMPRERPQRCTRPGSR